MDLHLSRVSKAVSTFLEVELSPSNLGLPQGPRAHLDRFRSFLHAFYVDKFGYWPPPKGTSFSRDLCRSMYYDFRALYDYLVDPDSSDSIQAQKPADGGICVLQNLQAFDKRHKYTPLPHPLPLLPATQLPTGRLQAQRNLVAMKLGNKQTKTDKQLMQLAALTAATNSKKTTVSNAPLVRLYKTFERDSLEKQKEKVSISDARKVRWILIYATLQMLISVTRAPREVRDTDGAHYPLCCLTAGTPPWRNKPAEDASPATDSGYSSAETDISNNSPAEPQPAPSATEVSYSIRPDCEASDYITHTNFKMLETEPWPIHIIWRRRAGATSRHWFEQLVSCATVSKTPQHERATLEQNCLMEELSWPVSLTVLFTKEQHPNSTSALV